MAGVLKKIELRAILLYLLMVFSISWFLIALIYFFGGLRTMAALGLYGLMMIPAIGAFLMRKWITREGFENSGLRIGKKKYYLIAWLLSLAAIYATYGIAVLTGFGRVHLTEREIMKRIEELGETYGARISVPPPPPGMSLVSLSALLAIGNVTVFLIPATIFGFGEEFGWRSYLLPKLLPLGRLKAFLLVGFIWWLWHLPLTMLTPLPVKSIVEVIALSLSGLISAILMGIILAWLFYASESILPAALAHITFNQANTALVIFISFNPLAFNLILTSILLLIVLILHRKKCIEVVSHVA